VQTQAGILYTRNGSFQVSAAGQLVTHYKRAPLLE
jgi:flagellar basal body rod protein FlgG